MKNLILSVGLLVAVNAFADIEYIPTDRSRASATEISRNRACFQELETQGCGKPHEDHQQFRSCLNNVFPTLTKDCQKMMSNLYGSK